MDRILNWRPVAGAGPEVRIGQDVAIAVPPALSRGGGKSPTSTPGPCTAGAARGTERLLAMVLCSAVVAGCASGGQSFDSSALRLFQPGVTTLDEASVVMQSPPVDVYRVHGGPVLARWVHAGSLVTDAIYINRELWLRFDSAGRYVGIDRRINIPRTHRY